ncbi:MAG: protease Do [Bacteroidetes bacterium]|nr:MAG: protease Do [Bacteroidota bacterium]PTM14274.1 MAG: protease Do [Bacteroidota bacterium]
MTTRQIAFTLLCSLLSALFAVGIFQALSPSKQIVIHEDAEPRYASTNDWLSELRPRTFLSATPTDFTQAASAVIPAVVFIRTFEESATGLFNRSGQTIAISTGSGVIISKDGYIVTNNHVIEFGQRYEVTLNDKREFVGTVIGTDPSTDLALLKIDGEQLPIIELGNSDSLQVGEWVLAIGSPFNLESTVTAGIVSAKGRNIDILDGQDRIESFIQTDAVVNPGNSGGALVNTNGELVGINTAIITRSGGYEGYSFAVPVNLIRKIVRDLSEFGSVQRGILGAYIANVTAAVAEEKGLDKVEGVLITEVTDDSSAENAGLLKGDVIVKINNVATPAVPVLQEILGQLRPGDRVKLHYIREGKEALVNLVLKNKLNSTSTLTANEERLLHELGFEVRNLSNLEKSRLKTEGVKVMSIFRGSEMETTNMEPGFIITAANDRKINNLNDLLRFLKRTAGEVVLEGVYENYQGAYYYSFTNK